MRLKNLLAKSILSTILIAGASFAGDYSSPWIFSGTIGTNATATGTAINDQVGSIVDLSQFNSGYTSSRIVMRGRNYDDVYKPAINASFEVRYAMSNLSEIFGSIGYSRAAGKDNVALGCAYSNSALAACDLNLTGNADDLEQYLLEIGYRQWLGGRFLSSPLKPYYAVHGGLAYNKAAGVSLKAGTTSLGDVELYKEGYNYTLGADLGASSTLSRTMEFAAEVGVRYTDSLKQNDTSACAYGLCKINDNDGNITIPVSLRLNAVF